MRLREIVIVTSLALTGVACSHESGHHHWAYTGDEGPQHWASLSPAYATCGSGQQQSPVDLKDFVEAELAPIDFHYKGYGEEILNNGHTIQVIMGRGNSISVDGHDYELKQFHFHRPSENMINGRTFPLEAHFVHADQDGKLAVVAVMLEEGSENAALAKAWRHIPIHPHDIHTLASPLSPNELLPASRDYYRYSGSLTTPPCTEGVTWLVMKQPLQASTAQLETFSEVMHGANNRPVQPLNGRKVMQ